MRYTSDDLDRFLASAEWNWLVSVVWAHLSSRLAEWGQDDKQDRETRETRRIILRSKVLDLEKILKNPRTELFGEETEGTALPPDGRTLEREDIARFVNSPEWNALAGLIGAGIANLSREWALDTSLDGKDELPHLLRAGRIQLRKDFLRVPQQILFSIQEEIRQEQISKRKEKNHGGQEEDL